MIYLTIGLFAIAATFGLTILIKWLTNKEVSKGVIYSHGAAAATGLILLILYAVQHPENFPKISIVLFAVAAIGGFYMFFTTMKQKINPVGIAFVHGLLAVGGFVTLLMFVFG